MPSAKSLVVSLCVSVFCKDFTALASPLKSIKRTELQASYDFVIVGGRCCERTTTPEEYKG